MNMDEIKAKEKELKHEEKEVNNQVADESIFNHFKEEFDILKDVEREVDDLYGQVKTHYDAMLQSRQSGSLNFLQSQTANLVSLKTTKLNVIKERINLKRNIIDFGFKKSLRENDNANDSAVAMELMKKLIDFESNNNTTIVDEEVGIVGEELEDVVDRYENEGKIQYSESEKDPNAVLNVDQVIRDLIEAESRKRDESDDDFTQAVEEEIPEGLEYEEEIPEGLEYEDEYEEIADNMTIMVAISPDRQQWKFIAINEHGELMEDYKYLPDSTVVDMKLMRINGELSALISDGTHYPVLTLDFE